LYVHALEDKSIVLLLSPIILTLVTPAPMKS